MTLTQYVDVANDDTFSQWLETQTRELGSIKGFYSYKFGIYKRQHPDERPETLYSDDLYSWTPKLGNDRLTAFRNVRAAIVATIEAAVTGNLTVIDNISLNSLVKWKIATLYSNESIVPIFKRDLLERITIARGLPAKRNRPFSEMLTFLHDLMPADSNIYAYTHDLLVEFNAIESDNDIHYYIIGSKYGDRGSENMFPDMEDASVVSTGFASNYNLSELYRAPRKEIRDFLIKKKEERRSYNALAEFLQLKPGDMVAIKSSGNPKYGAAYLDIIAYAVVVERQGEVYYHDPLNLGHCIHVEYIKTGLNNESGLGGFSRTISSVEEPQLINILFKGYKTGNTEQARKKIKHRRRNRKASKRKSIEGQQRRGSDGYVTNPKHNQIQQLLKDALVEEYGEDCVFLERNNVDITVIEPHQVTFYEVKPYDSPEW